MNTIVPVYYQIKQTIKDWITDSEFSSGDRIPSENKLAEKFNVNRLTVRQAISQLVQEGFLVRRRGHGTFVTDDKDLIDSLNLEYTGFMDTIFYHVHKATTKSVLMNRVIAPKKVRGHLELKKEGDEVIQIRRVRHLSGKSFNYTVNYLPLEIGSKITEQALYEKPLLEILEVDQGIQFAEAFQTIEASFAGRELAEKLGITPGSPMLYVERIMYDPTRKPVELVQTSFRGDLFKYIIRLKNVRRKSGNLWVHQSN